MIVWSKKPSKRHVRGRTRAKRWWTCNFGTLFVNKISLENHHHAVRLREHRFPCAHCEKTFLYRSNWQRHQRVHTGIKRWGCWVCGYRTTYLRRYRAHIARCESQIDSSPNYPCPKGGMPKALFQQRSIGCSFEDA